MSSYVHQRNLRITPAPLNLTKYAQKTLCTKTPLSRGLQARLFPTRKKINKRRNATQIPTGFGNPVKNKKIHEIKPRFRLPITRFRLVISVIQCNQCYSCSIYDCIIGHFVLEDKILGTFATSAICRLHDS